MSLGKIYTATPNQLKKHLGFIRDENTLVLLITRGGFDFEDAIRYRDLAPSNELFLDTLNAKKVESNWFKTYKEKYNRELEEDADKVSAIKDIIEDVEQGYDIVLVCYCKEYNECHRSLVADKLKSLGYVVNELKDKEEL